MSFLGDVWRGLMEMRGLSLTDANQWKKLGIISPTASGVRVSTEGALKFGAVFACVRVLAGTMAQLPLIVYQRRADSGRDRASDFYLYDLLHRQPNPIMTSFNFRMALQGHLALWGNAYAEIEFDNAGRVRALWPLRPDHMEKVETTGDSLLYHYRLPEGQLVTLRGAQVLHLRFMSPDGIMGYSPIALHRQGIGLGMAAEEFGARFFGNDARPGGVLQHPGILSDEAHAHLSESWESRHQGLDKSHRMAILEEGMTYTEIGIPPEDAQYIETRKFQKTEVAGIFGVPPHMIADLDSSTSWGTGIEQQGIGFVVHTMGPWLACWEQGLDASLLTRSERERYYTEFLVDALMRGDSAARSQFYQSLFNVGALSPNDIRRLENMNPVDGGDEHYVQLNMMPLSMASEGLFSQEGEGSNGQRLLGVDRHSIPVIVDEDDPIYRDMQDRKETRALQAAAGRHRLQQAQQRVYADVAGRLLRREANDVGNAARRMLESRDLAQFDQWLREFYRDFRGVVTRNMRPVAEAYAEMVVGEVQREVGSEIDPASISNFVRAYVAQQGVRHAANNEERIRKLMVDERDDLLAAIEAELETWRERDRAQSVALEESVRAGNAVAHFAYGVAGVMVLRWVAIGESCPYCTAQNGRTVSIMDVFVPAGGTVDPDDADRPMTVSRNIGHPPLHLGCDCIITAG